MRYTLQNSAGKAVHTGDSLPEVAGRPPEVVFHGPRTYVLRDRAELIYGEASAWFVPIAEGAETTTTPRLPALKPAPIASRPENAKPRITPGPKFSQDDLFRMIRKEAKP